MYTPDIPRCGRTGRTGNPCKSARLPGRPACAIHLTEHEQAIYASYQAGRSEAKMEMSGEYSRGFEAGRLAAQREIATTYQPTRPPRRLRLERRKEGQYVTVRIAGGPTLAVLWTGPGDLALGEKVFVPSLITGQPYDLAVVVALGSTSIGLHPHVISRVPEGGGVA